MKKAKSHIIDEAGVMAVKNLLKGSDWQVYDIKPDYGIDLPIQLFENGNATRYIAHSQIKTKQKYHVKRDGTVTYKPEPKHLQLYALYPLPVFIIAVNLSANEGYWCFFQEYIDKHYPNNSWASKRVSVHIPTSNRLDDLAAFREAIIESQKYIERRHAPSAEDRIEDEVKTLESLDPRFAISVKVDASGRTYVLNPKAPVTASIRINAPEIAKRVQEAIEHGTKIDINPGDVSAEGSELMNYFWSKATTLDAKRHAQGTVAFYEVREDEDICRIPALSCHVEGGTKEFRLEALFPHDLGTFLGNFLIDENALRGTFTVQALMDGWLDKPVLCLPFFEELHFLLARNCSKKFCFHQDSVKTFSINLGEFNDDIGPTRQFLNSVHKMRVVGKAYGLDPKLPRDLNNTEAGIITIIHNAITNAGPWKPLPSTTGTVAIDRATVSKVLIQATEEERRKSTFHLPISMFKFLGNEIQDDKYFWHLRGPVLPTPSKLHSLVRRTPLGQDVTIPWKVGPNTEAWCDTEPSGTRGGKGFIEKGTTSASTQDPPQLSPTS